MKVQVYCVFDNAVLAYNVPFYARHIGEAVRSFKDLAHDPQSNVARHPTDFSLFALGEYDDATGLFSCSQPVRVIGAVEVLQQPVAV